MVGRLHECFIVDFLDDQTTESFLGALKRANTDRQQSLISGGILADLSHDLDWLLLLIHYVVCIVGYADHLAVVQLDVPQLTGV